MLDDTQTPFSDAARAPPDEFEPEATSRSGSASESASAADDLRIGMYHQKAGSRSAGGIAIYVQEMVRELSASNETYLYTEQGELTEKVRNADATVCQIPGRDGLGSDLLERLADSTGVVPESVARKLPLFVNAARSGVVEHINRHVDVLVTHQFLDDVLLSNAVDVPVVYITHGLQRVGLGARAREHLSRSVLNVANSRQTASELAAEFAYEPREVVYPGVNVEQFSPDAAPAFDREEVTVLFVGRLVEEKGIYDLVDAFAAVDRDRDAHLAVVGRGDEAAVRERARQRGVADAVTFEGAVSHADLPSYYTACDVLCHPSYYESFAMVNLEAMACGTPVVTTDLEAVTEYATDGETCLLVPPGDADALADRLDTLVADADLRDRLGAAGRAVATDYSWAESAAELERICADVAATQSARRR